jgi:hypothetical protein
MRENLPDLGGKDPAWAKFYLKRVSNPRLLGFGKI